ncbi:MAG: SufD family Fe-S cluster assembly protein [Ruminococcus sp.]|nr:SufD family Fe-S cluster assembly protein [Ruminococcus sp.]
MEKTTEELLAIVSEYSGKFTGAYNIRENGTCAGRQSSENIELGNKEDAPGLVVKIKPYTKGETVYIPACVTKGGIEDIVYNDFFVGEGADVIIVAGCGVHTDDGHDVRHHGIHRFILDKGARVLYKEKHVGKGAGQGAKRIDPVTEIIQGEDSYLEMDTIQIGGIDSTFRKTTGTLGKGAKLVIKERILTDGTQTAKTEFAIDLNGEDSGADIVSRSVARGNSYQEYHSKISGNARCTGHSECDAILAENGKVNAAPELFAGDLDASLIHEAAIGKIAGEQIIKLRTLGLTEEEAERRIIEGFLKG